ncbi:MAG: hypothetical protein H6604_04740 [Flavobacteriales bacterium]|nr:hypothetical protein [Flavobacteriales bacterium]
MKNYSIYALTTVVLLSSCSINTRLQKNYQWNSTEVSNFIVYYKANSLVEKNIEQVVDNLECSLEHAQQKSKIEEYRIPIRFYIVDSNEEIKQLTNENIAGISYIKSNLIIQNMYYTTQSHEPFHLLSLQNWGNTKLWIQEGSAVYSDGTWYGKDIDVVSKKLLKKNQLVPFSDLMKNRNFRKNKQSDMYIQSGSFCKYLIENYGLESFIQFWKTKTTLGIYHKTILELENDWKKYLLGQ